MSALDKKRIAELCSIIASSLERARRMEMILAGEGGIVTVWRALAEARRGERPTLAAWAGEGRPPLDPARLETLDEDCGVSLDLTALLPRLDAHPLARLDDGSDEAEQARAILVGWLDERDVGAPLARHGALLLAEMGRFSPRAIPLLCACLSDPVDLTRYRARQALNQEHTASVLDRETYGSTTFRASTCVG